MDSILSYDEFFDIIGEITITPGEQIPWEYSDGSHEMLTVNSVSIFPEGFMRVYLNRDKVNK